MKLSLLYCLICHQYIPVKCIPESIESLRERAHLQISPAQVDIDDKLKVSIQSANFSGMQSGASWVVSEKFYSN